jgi:hypothetical protein
MMLRISPKIFSLIMVATLHSVTPTRWAQQSTPNTKPFEKPNGTITGRVINSAGDPMTGAVVYVRSVGNSTRSQKTPVDANGDFKMDGLEAGLYSVSASAPGYVSAPQPSSNDSPTYYHIGDSVTLRMIKGGVITGTVTGPRGPLVAVGIFPIRVRDEEGKALLYPVLFRERSTDDRGIYRMYGLPPGAYVVAAAKPRTGLVAPGAYDNDAPTYFPSSTRDTASEIMVREGEEITADIQYRSEPGHAVSGKVVGATESPAQFAPWPSASISIKDLSNRTAMIGVSASSNDNFSFALYGVPDGEYELSAMQFLQSRDELRSQPHRVTVRGADVTGLILTLAPLGSIEGRLVFENDPKASCGKRPATAAQETIVFARRYEPEEKSDPNAKPATLPEGSLRATNYLNYAVGDARGSLALKNFPPGSYRIDPQPPASGWYVRSISIGAPRTAAAKAANLAVARDGITLKSGERVSGLTVTIAEGAASLRGRVTVVEGQGLPSNLRVYLVPAEKDGAENVLRFFEVRAENDGTFVIGNLAPGRYWIIAQPAEETDAYAAKSIRRDNSFRAKVLHDADALKKEIAFKPCERTVDYDLPYSTATSKP